MNERFDKNDEWVGKYYLYPNDNNDRISEGGRRTLEQNKEKKDNMPLVSIITVVYNAFETLERTIKSVLNQDYKNIEYIIIDGGSTDGSLDIIKKYEKELEYYISEPDKGIYNAMNKGIALAQGDYICLLNADDYYKPEFVSNSIKKSLETNADIVYSALHWVNEDRYPTKEINEGILLYHMNINHMTFLVSKATYNNIGPYDESNKLFSDDVWIRTSYLKNVRFIYCPKMMVIFGEGGLSSGDNQEKRNNIIKESTGHLVKFFPFLTEEEGEALYLSRFYLNKIRDLLNIYYRYGEREELFRKALSKYIDFALKYRKNYIFDDTKIKKYLPDYMKLAKYLDVPYSAFNFNIPDINIKNIFNKIENIKQSISNKDNNSYTVLHFVSKFSSPSETFIYDLINRLENKTEYNNIVLCDNRILLKERPFKNCIQIDWDNLPVELGYMLYEFLFNELKPDVIIAHFALNGWKLYKRIIPLGIKLPTIHMTHGIDVFSIDKNNEYRKFILDYASIDANTSFTTVSNYLLNELVERGIPEQKINLVPNVIHNRFFENRKTSDFYNGKRTLKLLNVGRLINWKGHDDLLDGLKYFIDNVSDNVSLTIVYANDGRELKNLKDKCKKLNIENKVRFIDFIDFDSEPDYFTKFDMFISSSKYTEGIGKRSETFGMSTLEAISAGLPVIVTDAGGSPEVVGYEGKYSKTVPHGNGLAIGKAIEEFYNDISRFSDNIEYAKSRLKKFSPNTQINQLESLINKLTKKKLRVGIFSSEIKGGAGGASTRVHKALMLNNVETHLITRNSSKKNIYEQPNFTFLSPDIGLRWEELYSKKYIKNGYTIFSLNEPKLYHNTLKEITKDFDIINIQWIARFLSVENIAYLSNLGKPLVITIRDMNPLTGGCHYFHGCDKWQKDCYGCPQLLGDKDNMPAKILELKKSLWNTNNISIITLSNHTKNIVKKSPLFSDCKIKVIGNPIDIDTFSPKEGAKDYFNIKSDDKIIFYIPSYDSKVKGGEELKKSLKIMKSNYPNIKVQILAAGSSSSLLKADDFPFPIINLGHLNDKTILAKAYSAADLTAIPSLEETFSNTAAESVACGTPIVGFDTGAIKDIAGNGIRGKSVPVGDVEGLAEALYDILYSENLSLACREYAEQNFTFIGQGKKYKLFFEEHLENQTSPTKTNISNISELNSLIALDTFYWYSKAIQNKKNKLKAILNSKTYKLGRLLTAPYRKIKNIFKKKNKLKAILNSKTYKLGRLLTAPYRKLKSFFPRIHQKLTKNQTKQITRN